MASIALRHLLRGGGSADAPEILVELFSRATRSGFLVADLLKHGGAEDTTQPQLQPLHTLLSSSARFFAASLAFKESATTQASTRGYCEYLSAATRGPYRDRIEAFNMERYDRTQFELRREYFRDAGWAEQRMPGGKISMRPGGPLLKMYPSLLDEQRWPTDVSSNKTSRNVEQDNAQAAAAVTQASAFKAACIGAFDELQRLGGGIDAGLVEASFQRLRKLQQQHDDASLCQMRDEALAALAAAHSLGDHTLEVKYYPRLKAPASASSTSSSSAGKEEVVVRIPPHADLSTVTILLQAGVKGGQLYDLSSASVDAGSTLEIADRSSSNSGRQAGAPRAWIPLRSSIGNTSAGNASGLQAVVNTGDFFRAWSCSVWPSTLHRVVGRPAAAPSPSSPATATAAEGGKGLDGRISVAFFYRPNWHAQVTHLRLFQELLKADPALGSRPNDGDDERNSDEVANMAVPFPAGDAMPMA